jgi:hypothetical protein
MHLSQILTGMYTGRYKYPIKKLKRYITLSIHMQFFIFVRVFFTHNKKFVIIRLKNQCFQRTFV